MNSKFKLNVKSEREFITYLRKTLKTVLKKQTESHQWSKCSDKPASDAYRQTQLLHRSIALFMKNLLHSEN